MGWCLLALCWLAYLLNTGQRVHADAAFGDSVRTLLPPILQGVMLACVLAAGMSTGSAIQVTVAGLFAQNIYRPYLRPDAADEHYVKVTRVVGLVIIAAAMGFAVAMRASVVEAILDYFNLTACVGIAVGMGILWRRMNSPGFFASAILASVAFLLARTAAVEGGTLYVLRFQGEGLRLGPVAAGCVETLTEMGLLGGGATLKCTRLLTIGLPLATGMLAGVVASLLSRPPRPEVIENFFKKIYVPIGQEHLLEKSLDEAVPPEKRLLTAGGLFLVKPTTQSWVGFLVTLGLTLGLLSLMVLLLR